MDGDGVPILVFAAIAALVVTIGVFAYRAHKKRMEALTAWAQQLGFSFDESHDSSFDDHYAEFSQLRQGSNRYAYNVMQGEYRGRGAGAFDYHYVTYSKDSKGNTQTNHHHFSAIVLESGLPLKALFVRPENFFDKVGEFLGFDDIDFESAEFSRKFCVKAADRRWAFDVLHQKAIEMLLERPAYTIEIADGGRIMATLGGTMQAEQFQAGLDLVCELLDLLPMSVLQELQEGR